MKTSHRFLILLIFILFSGCGGKHTSSPPPVQPPVIWSSNMATPTALSEPKNGEYPGRGRVTKINMNLGSVELNHEEIKGVMPPMIMEFYVSDKAILNAVKVGDKVDFTLLYKDRTETIVKIQRAK